MHFPGYHAQQSQYNRPRQAQTSVNTHTYHGPHNNSIHYVMKWNGLERKCEMKFEAHFWNLGLVRTFIHKHRHIDGLDVAWIGGSALFSVGADMLHTDFQLRLEVELCLKILERLWYGTLLQQDSSHCSFCLEFCPPSGLRCPDELKP